MTETKLRSVCSMMERFIAQARAEISGKEREIRRLQENISKLQAKPEPNLELIEALQDRIDTLERELENDRNALQVLEEEFSASCL